MSYDGRNPCFYPPPLARFPLKAVFNEFPPKAPTFCNFILLLFLTLFPPQSGFSRFSIRSQKSTHCRAEDLLQSSLPKTSLFQTFSFCLISLILAANLKLTLPLTSIPCHQLCIRSLNPSTLSHIFSNLKGVGPRLIPPSTRMIGK